MQNQALTRQGDKMFPEHTTQNANLPNQPKYLGCVGKKTYRASVVRGWDKKM